MTENSITCRNPALTRMESVSDGLFNQAPETANLYAFSSTEARQSSSNNKHFEALFADSGTKEGKNEQMQKRATLQSRVAIMY